MDLWQAVLLGIVQGLTEFLPVSSSAHLRIVPALVGWDDPGAAFTAVIQLGTLAAVLAYFRDDIWRIGRAWFGALVGRTPAGDLDARMGWMMIVATVPIVICGLLFKHEIETVLRSLYVVTTTMIALAVVLAIAEGVVRARRQRGIAQKDLHHVTWTDAIVVGAAQALALIPGASRSGVTITGGLFCGLSRDTAARFAFLLSLPSVLAAGLYEMYDAREALLETQQNVLALCASSIVAAIVGYASIAFLLRYLKTHTTYVFIAYRLLLGGSLLWWLAGGTLPAN